MNTVAVTDANLNDSTPAAAAGGVNVKWQRSGTGPDSVSAYVQGFGAAAIGAVPASGGGTSNYLRADGTWAAPAGTATNALLDGTKHTDTTAYTVTRGAIPYGKGASPTWDGLAIGGRGKALVAGSAEPYWGAPLDLAMRLRGRRIFTAAIFGFQSAGTASNTQSGSTLLSIVSGQATVSTSLGMQRGEFTGAGTTSARVRTAANMPGDKYPYLRVFARVDDNDDGTMWVGWSTTTLSSAADPGMQCAVFRCRNGTDTNWQAITSDSGGTEQTTDTGIALDTNWHCFEVFTDDGGTNWKFYIDGVLEATHGTNVPTATTSMAAAVENFAISSSSRGFSIKSLIATLGNPNDAWDDLEAAAFL